MAETTIRQTKWFWPWQDEQEEAWLEQMSQQGLHLKRILMGAQYDFAQGEPLPYIYRLDFRDAMKQKDKASYLQLFIEAGWEYLGEMNGWQYFRRLSQPGSAEELFTDADSKIQKYRRFLTWFGLTYPFYMVIFIALMGDAYPAWVVWVIIAALLITLALWLLVLTKVWQRVRQLKTL